jgi:cyanophycinase
MAFACVALAGTVMAQAPAFNPAAPRIGEPIKGSLVIVGGGGTPVEVWQRFMQLAGGDTARIVQIQTAAANAAETDTANVLRAWHARNPRSAVIFHTTNKDSANSPSYVRPISQATGVWFVGGVQSRVTDAYSGTLVETELHALLERGGSIGGTSAGAAIMTRVMITGGNPEANLGTGFGFLPGAIADQHFLARNRFPRLVGALRKNPGLMGFGIDEGTALIVHSRDQLEVLGRSLVLAVRLPAAGAEPVVDTLKPRPPRPPRPPL